MCYYTQIEPATKSVLNPWRNYLVSKDSDNFVNSIDVVNDFSEYATNLSSRTWRTHEEDKLQNLLQVKNAWRKPAYRIKILCNESAALPPNSKSLNYRRTGSLIEIIRCRISSFVI